MFGQSSQNRTTGPSIGANGLAVSLNYFTALPNPSTINDAQLTVIFKALMKKHSTTKEKSLNDFLAVFDDATYAQELSSQTVVSAWIQMYPKLAFENPRNVRAVSHKIQASFLKLVGGKNFAKYLKSSVPVWLAGIFDSDKVVSSAAYTSLLESFQNDKAKVDTKLWHIFVEEIVTFVVIGVTQENKDSISDVRNTSEEDSVSKYERILNASLMLLTRIFELSISEPFEISEKAIEGINDVLNHEQLWDYMGTVFDHKSFNSILALSYLRLLRAIFKSDQDGQSQNSLCKKVSSVKSLYKLVSKKIIKNVKLKKHKNPAQNIVYSTVILQFWGTLTVLTEFPRLEGKSVPKSSLWELGGSKAPQRLIDYLSLGPCNADPAYYVLIDNFFKVYDNTAEVKLTSLEFSRVIALDVLTRQLEETRSIQFKETAVRCLTSFLGRIESNDDRRNITIECLPSIIHALTTNNRNSASSVQVVSSFIAKSFVDGDVSIILHTLAEQVVNSILDNEDTSYSVKIDLIDEQRRGGSNALSEIVTLVTQKIEQNEDLLVVSKGLEVLTQLLKKEPKLDNNTFNTLVKFVQGIISSLKTENYKSVVDFIFSAWEFHHLKDNLNINELIEDITVKGQMYSPNVMTYFIDRLISIAGWTSQDFEKYPNLQRAIENITSKTKKSEAEWRSLFRLTNDPKVFHALVKSTSEFESIEFLKNWEKFGDKELIFDIKILEEDLKPILDVCWTHIDSQYAAEFLTCVKKSSGDYLVLERLWFLIVKSSNSTSFTSIWKALHNAESTLTYLVDRLEQEMSHLPDIDKNTLAISNSLGSNIHLIPNSKNGVEQTSSFVGIANFFSQNPVDCSDRFAAWCGILNQYIADLVFTSAKSDEIDQLVTIQQKLSKQYVSSLRDLDLYETLAFFFSQETEDIETNSMVKVLIRILDNSAGSLMSFCARVLQESIASLSDAVSTKVLESYPLDFYKLNKEPLKLGILLSGLREDLLLSSKFDRVRNFVFAELLGVKKASAIVTEGVKWLALSTNFLELNEVPDDYSPVPPHRLNMIVKQFQFWLESDASYEAEFIVVRSSILRFLTALIQSSTNDIAPELWDYVLEILNENLSMIQVEAANLELRYFTLKLFSVVLKSRHTIDAFDKDSFKSLSEELYEIFFNEDIENRETISNTPTNLCLDILERCFYYVKEYKDLDRFESFYDKLVKTKFTQVKRICVSVLHPLILQIQQDLVVEYQLSKSNLGSEESELSDSDIELPEQLLSYIRQYNDERDNIFTYLACWYLIFDCFKDISYGIRNQYLNQLSKEPILNQFLYFVFESVDIRGMMNKKDIQLTGEEIQNFEITTSGFLDEDKFNFDKLVLHIYFSACEYVGSDVQFWFNSLRDIQMKQEVERFTARFISEALTGRLLQEVDDAKTKISTDVMSVKVNRVTKEVKSVFEIDEQAMEMVVKIPKNFPLSNVTVEGPKRIGVKEAQWRAWLLSSQKVITLTNGSIVEAVELFKKNVDLHFSGFEDCAICYSILHQDHSLPSKTCATCSNKFHAGCLYKWFKSSGSSTCPLCRSPFNFRAPK